MGAGLSICTELMRYAHAKQGLTNNNYLSYTHEHGSHTHTPQHMQTDTHMQPRIILTFPLNLQRTEN